MNKSEFTSRTTAGVLLEKLERAGIRTKPSEDVLLSELRRRQKLLDPNKFSKEKVKVK